MVRRVTALLLGLVLIAAVVWLWTKARTDSTFVLWFGLASALFAPTGIGLISYAIRAGEHQLLKRLSKVPEIDELISEAESKEERIRLLEEERSRLAEAVRLETRRQALISRQSSLESDATRILKELQAIDAELKSLQIDIEASTVTEEIQRLNERLQARQQGDMVIRFGEAYINVSRDLVRAFAFVPLALPTTFLAEIILRGTEALTVSIFKVTQNFFRMIFRTASTVGETLAKLIDRILRR